MVTPVIGPDAARLPTPSPQVTPCPFAPSLLPHHVTLRTPR